MKYGEELARESVPEWSMHNLDYNGLKDEIKVRTTRSQATAIAIPGTPNTALKKFEEHMYQELQMQHDRIGLFVISKSSEFLRRLASTDRNVKHWIDKHSDGQDSGPPNSDATSSETRARSLLKTHQRYFKFEKQILDLGDEVNKLEKFVKAQVIAFRKILKKYKKWTGSATLGSDLSSGVLHKPKSFTHYNFTELRDRCKQVLSRLQTRLPQLAEPNSPPSSDDYSSEHTLTAQSNSGRSRRSRPSIPSSEATFMLAAPQPMPKYWNEYDDGSEAGTPDDEYAIYINPDQSDSFWPFSLSSPVKKVKAWFRNDSARPSSEDVEAQHDTDEHRGLLSSTETRFYYSSTAVNSDSEAEGYSSSDQLPSRGYKRVYALPSVDQQFHRLYREKILFWATFGSFFCSFILLGISGILLFTGRHKLRVEVDVVVTLGAVASLFCACSGLVITFQRHELGWSQYLMAWSTFIVSCLLNGMLLILVVGNTP